MKNWGHLIAVQAFILGIGGSVHAADLIPTDAISGSWKGAPYEQPALWSGAYVGIFAGGGSGDADITDVFDYDGDPTAKNSINYLSSTAGLTVGYNIQQDSFVIGLEAALGTLNFSDSVSVKDLEPHGGHADPIGAKYAISGNLYGELTGRLGYASGNELFYVKGGAAFVNADFSAQYSGDNACTHYNYYDCISKQSPFDFGKSETLLGWTLGVGMEYALSNTLSLKAEYQHFDFGTISYDYEGSYKFRRYHDWHSDLSGDLDADVTLDVVKLGLNYRLQDAYDTLK